MIEEYATNIAVEMGFKLSDVTVVEGRRVGCTDMHLLNLTANGQQVSALIHQTELDELEVDSSSERLSMKLHFALTRLQHMQV